MTTTTPALPSESRLCESARPRDNRGRRANRQRNPGSASRPARVIIAVVGPTASGKSDLALELAGALATVERTAPAQNLPDLASRRSPEGTPAIAPGDRFEVIGADAMQLYRGMDIGTAKLPPNERRGIVHHQIDVLDIHQEASVATYQRHAREDLAGIHARGKHALVVGGSGLYIRALLDRMEFPPTDPAARARLEARLEDQGPEALHALLAAADPAAAATINPRNGRRIVRALEVIELTGRPFSASLPTREHVLPALQIGIRVEPDLLQQRIEQRAEAMFRHGLLEEVEGLAKQGLAQTKTAARATGYAQALQVLAGEVTPEEAWEATALATNQLAKRQMKWFGADPRIVWVDGSDPGRALEQALNAVANAQDPEAPL